MKGRTYYSNDVEGGRGNYHWPVRFDLTDGYLGISQKDGGEVKDRVLLCPKQVKELTDFLGRKGR